MITITGMDVSTEPVVPSRALVVSAHPDDVDFGAKLAALRAHASQTGHVDLQSLIGGWTRATAEEGGLPEGRLAEAFFTCRTG